MEQLLALKSQAGGSHETQPDGPGIAAPTPSPTAPGVTASFDAIPYTGWLPPDATLAAGPSDLATAVNSTFRLYSKTGGQLFSTTLLSWFSNVLPPNNSGITVFDPVLLYDNVAARFILVAVARRVSDGYSSFLISVSDNSTATGGWCNWSLNARLNGATNTNTWADYPKVGTNSNAIILSANMFDLGAGGFQYTKLRFLPKSALYNTTCPGFGWWDIWNITNADGSKAFTVQPANSYFNSNITYLINSQSAGPNRLTLWRLSTTAANPPVPTLTRQATLISNTNFGVPPDAQQLGGAAYTRIDTGDARLLGAVYRASGLWTFHTVNCLSTYSCVRWYQINPGTNAITQQSSFGLSGYYYYYPALTADSAGNAWMVFNRSGASEYAGIRYTGRKSTDGLNLMQGSALLTAGQGCYARNDTIGRNRWGDYNGISLDPSTGTPWIFSEYAFGTSSICSNNVWRTRAGRLTMP